MWIFWKLFPFKKEKKENYLFEQTGKRWKYGIYIIKEIITWDLFLAKNSSDGYTDIITKDYRWIKNINIDCPLPWKYEWYYLQHFALLNSKGNVMKVVYHKVTKTKKDTFEFI